MKSIQYSSQHRSLQSEIMDDFTLKGKELDSLLTDLKRVNKQLGGVRITIDGIAALLENWPKNKEVTIVDLGCGDGELLRQCAIFGEKQGYSFKLIGIDANMNIIKIAKTRSREFSEIRYQQIDIFSEEFKSLECDIMLCTLFLHHFRNTDVLFILKHIIDRIHIGAVVNDLERSRSAFCLFRLYSKFFIKTKIARHDGLVSIARGFKRNEIVELLEQLGNVDYTLRWKWAFRYQWLLKKQN